jgi:hypothetical protein
MNITRKIETSNAREYLRQQFSNVLCEMHNEWCVRNES